MNSSHDQVTDDLLVFSDESTPDAVDLPKDDTTWKILIVDDDEQVHKVTTLALSHVLVHGRSLEFLHAFTSAEAMEILQTTDDIAALLLDVVMERDDAGLFLIKAIREDLGNQKIRIILRTGQPGYAPELEVIQQYDINDYKMKSELTRTRLITSITTALRSYDQIKRIEESRLGLQQIIRASSELLSIHSLGEYSAALIRQIGSILDTSILSAACLQGRLPLSSESTSLLYSLGDPPFLDVNMNAQGDPEDQNRGVIDYLVPKLEKKRSWFRNDEALLFISGVEDRWHAIYLVLDTVLNDGKQRLLEVFAANLGVGFRNIELVQNLENFAFFDPLTALPNKTRFTEIIDSTLKSSNVNQLVVMLDIDDFSELNDSLGHEHGDALLKAVAERLVSNYTGSFVIARIAGDTFGILGPEGLLRPQMILSLFEEPFLISETPFPIRITLGLVHLQDVETGAEAVKNSNIAMKRAKSSARSRFLYFSSAMKDTIHRRMLISKDLKPALLNKEFILHYQPQIDLTRGQTVGTEALIRWKRPTGEIVPPFHFISVAESSGIINDIGRWVFSEACRQALEWHAMGDPSWKPRMAINVSMRQVHNPNFLPFLSHVIRDYGIEPDLLEIEITESLVMQDAERVIDLLKKIKDLGMRIAIDDFGTGFSSLNYLLRLPIDRLKIDRSFILNLETDRRSKVLTEVVIQLAQQLELGVIAEGVENQQQIELVRSMGCNEVQGFFYSKPLPPDDLITWVRNSHSDINNS
ncbi:GGDEF/EAL domain-containing response regulator [Spirochaeta lutea]|uniref:GGDEF/EAL domain-containing response regulator n=1 Tax=Spirochaeta lutea TaxID=1480694 RepID=UPI00068CD0E2|nr:EAL domain-containing protein [Spirochaeta lutea]